MSQHLIHSRSEVLAKCVIKGLGRVLKYHYYLRAVAASGHKIIVQPDPPCTWVRKIILDDAPYNSLQFLIDHDDPLSQTESMAQGDAVVATVAAPTQNHKMKGLPRRPRYESSCGGRRGPRAFLLDSAFISATHVSPGSGLCLAKMAPSLFRRHGGPQRAPHLHGGGTSGGKTRACRCWKMC